MAVMSDVLRNSRVFLILSFHSYRSSQWELTIKEFTIKKKVQFKTFALNCVLGSSAQHLDSSLNYNHHSLKFPLSGDIVFIFFFLH